ncbi:MAG: MarR family transcriptional regulator [Myxococcaceae bacterium]
MKTTDPDDALVDALARSAFATMAVLSRLSAKHGLSLTQLRVLGILRDRQPRMATLADHLGLEKSTLTGLVSRAERNGLVDRIVTREDARVVEVRLTRRGLELARRLTAEVREALAPQTAGLGPAQRRQLRLLLEQLVHIAQ